MTVTEKLIEAHAGDQRQLDVIFSDEKKLLIEAPAGYGKTKTMVSKIAYLLSTNRIPNPKKILALTFSVNAAYKIKKDVAHNIPVLLAQAKLDVNINDKMIVSNYHGFARRIIKRHGHNIHSSLIKIDAFQSIDDSDPKKVMQSISGIPLEVANLFSDFSLAIKNIDGKFVQDNFNAYNDAVIQNLIPLNVIPYNGILSIASKILIDHPTIRQFYQRLFGTVIVDEYQDTNVLSFGLLKQLFHDETNIILMGDSLQRIYGFIGAIPNLLSISEGELKLKKVPLNKNHRFQSNLQMLLLDNNIRRNAESPINPTIEQTANIDLKILDNQTQEANYLIDKALELSEVNSTAKVAILIKQRSNNSTVIVSELERRNVPYFYGLFSEDDTNYIKFNRESLFEFIEILKVNGTITKKVLAKLQIQLRGKIASTDALTNSLFKLLEIFFQKVFTDFSFLTNEERVTLIKDTLENNGLKQYVEFIDARIILSTIHGAKGLEWEYVLIPDMEQFSFPNYMGLCGNCSSQKNCDLKLTPKMEPKFLDDLSVFYVAVTRARKQVYFSASRIQINYKGNEENRNLSCFLRLPGINN